MGILLFNWVGYRGIFSYLENNSSQLLNERLDNREFEEESLITIKLPVENLPYYTNSPIFERVNGKLTIGGMQYQYVEKRIFNDSIEMRCIPNAQSTHLTNARDEFFKMVNDLQQASSSGKHAPAKQTGNLKNNLPDYIQHEQPASFTPAFSENAENYPDLVVKTSDCLRYPQEQPPEKA